jgi:hypothetical protein
MAVSYYLGKPYKHPQENPAFRLLCSAGSSLLTGDAAIVGNVTVRGWNTHDALDLMRSLLEKRHPGTQLPDRIVTAISRALAGGSPPLSAVLRDCQALTSVDLGRALESYGILPGEHP